MRKLRRRIEADIEEVNHEIRVNLGLEQSFGLAPDEISARYEKQEDLKLLKEILDRL
jgi:hypothetical protein